MSVDHIEWAVDDSLELIRLPIRCHLTGEELEAAVAAQLEQRAEQGFDEVPQDGASAGRADHRDCPVGNHDDRGPSVLTGSRKARTGCLIARGGRKGPVPSREDDLRGGPRVRPRPVTSSPVRSKRLRRVLCLQFCLLASGNVTGSSWRVVPGRLGARAGAGARNREESRAVPDRRATLGPGAEPRRRWRPLVVPPSRLSIPEAGAPGCRMATWTYHSQYVTQQARLTWFLHPSYSILTSEVHVWTQLQA